ncbi:hypothetical protein ACU61A_15275 [Pseudonocardia sichuanensis]
MWTHRHATPPDRVHRARRGAVAGVLASTLLASAVACGDEDTSAGPETGVSVEDIQERQYFHEGEYLGQTVTISAAVTAVLSPRHLEVAGTDYGEDSLLVVTEQPVEVAVGDVLRVTGTVGQYHVTMEEEGVPPVPYDQYEKYETEAFLHHAAVEPLPPAGERR